MINVSPLDISEYFESLDRGLSSPERPTALVILFLQDSLVDFLLKQQLVKLLS